MNETSMMTTAALVGSGAAGERAAARRDKWDGGDDLPTNPLACDAGAASRRRPPSPMTAASRPARPTRPASRSRWSTCRS